MTLFISFPLFFLAPAVSLTIFGAGLTILRMFQGCFDVRCLFFNEWKEFGEPTRYRSQPQEPSFRVPSLRVPSFKSSQAVVERCPIAVD